MILIINGGSSSIKFALCAPDKESRTHLSGEIKRIGIAGTSITVERISEGIKETLLPDVKDFAAAIGYFSNWLKENINLVELTAVGHRVVQGMHYTKPILITTRFLTELKEWVMYDPDHLPAEINLMETLQRLYPLKPHVACFDTGFHQAMPSVATLLALPQKYYEMGLRRYGFHGLSYEYLMHELKMKKGVDAASGKVILAHLGSGASMAAVKGGVSMDTTMGFSPSSGIMMGTRPGDIDPGIVSFLLEGQHLSVTDFNDLIHHQSGLLGVSGSSADMGDLLQIEKTDPAAAAAIQLFCYQARKCIGAYAALLEGLDILIFSGGIGENSAVIRSRICQGFSFLGISIDEEKNNAGHFTISTADSTVTVLIIPANESWAIARCVHDLIISQNKS